MAGEKTEKPTAKRLRDAREKGQVVKSQEVNTAIMMLVVFSVVRLASSHIIEKSGDMLSYYLSSFDILGEDLTATDTFVAINHAVLEIFFAIWPVLLAALIAGVVVNILQIGFLFTTKTLQPKFEKINPISGFKRMFSMRALTEMFKSIMKIILIFSICYVEIKKQLVIIPNVMNLELKQIFAYCGDVIVRMVYNVCIALCILAVADYLYQRFEFMNNMKMSKDEVKQEYKQMEGDPQIKGKIRQKQREAAVSRMMNNIPKADVVITNPTHYAVALRYDEKTETAPVVIAKGKDYLALKIKEVAKENRVPIVENKPLARSLYALCELDEQIPEELFIAVAEILAKVYSANKRR